MNSKKRALTNPGFVYEQQYEGFDQSGVRLLTARSGFWLIWGSFMNSNKRALTILGSFMNNNKRALTNMGFVYELQEESFD